MDGRTAQGRASERHAGRGFCKGGGSAVTSLPLPTLLVRFPHARSCAEGSTTEASEQPPAGNCHPQRRLVFFSTEKTEDVERF